MFIFTGSQRNIRENNSSDGQQQQQNLSVSRYQMLARMQNQEFSPTTGINAKWYSYFGRLTISYKTKYTLAIILHLFSQGVENLCPYKNLHTMFKAALFISAKTWKQ